MFIYTVSGVEQSDSYIYEYICVYMYMYNILFHYRYYSEYSLNTVPCAIQ